MRSELLVALMAATALVPLVLALAIHNATGVTKSLLWIPWLLVVIAGVAIWYYALTDTTLLSGDWRMVLPIVATVLNISAVSAELERIL